MCALALSIEPSSLTPISAMMFRFPENPMLRPAKLVDSKFMLLVYGRLFVA
jgi:hypothetical protein